MNKAYVELPFPKTGEQGHRKAKEANLDLKEQGVPFDIDIFWWEEKDRYFFNPKGDQFLYRPIETYTDRPTVCYLVVEF